MKRFILSILCVAVFFVGLGSLIEKVGAKFKSDEKALELVSKARAAIGGDAAINNIQSLRIVGQTTHVFNFDGKARTETGDTEIAMQLPNQFMKLTKLGNGEGNAAAGAQLKKQIDLVVTGEPGGERQFTVSADGGEPNSKTVQKIIVKKPDGTTQEVTGADLDKYRVEKGSGNTTLFKIEDQTVASDGANQVFIRRSGDAGGVADHHEGMRQNEMLRLTLSLLMSAPQGLDVDYQLGGEGNVDGTPCNILVAGFGGTSYKIYLNKSTDLPMMLSYTSSKMPAIIRLHAGPKTSDDAAAGQKIVFEQADGARPQTAEFNVKFDDYRSVGGVQLPYRWTQTVGGNADETFEVSAYEVNPTNIADKFKNNTVMFRTKKPADQ